MFSASGSVGLFVFSSFSSLVLSAVCATVGSCFHLRTMAYTCTYSASHRVRSASASSCDLVDVTGNCLAMRLRKITAGAETKSSISSPCVAASAMACPTLLSPVLCSPMTTAMLRSWTCSSASRARWGTLALRSICRKKR